MYEFKDYFDPEKKELPYVSSREELEDRLRFLDMILENYLEFKGLGRERKLFSRGLVITESEMERYFEMPPYFRERDICDPSLAAAAEAALDYIRGRTAKTEEAGNGGLLRINVVKTLFELDSAGVLAVVMALAAVTDRRYERIFGFLQDDIMKTRPTVGLLEALMGRITPRTGAEDLPECPLKEELFRSVFYGTGEAPELDTPLELDLYLKRFLLGMPEREDHLPEALTIFKENTEIPVFFEQSAGELAYVFTDVRDQFCFLESGDEEAVLHLLYSYCKEHDELLYVLDLQQLTELSPEEQAPCLSELSVRMRMEKARLAVRYKTPEDASGSAAAGDPAARRQKSLEAVGNYCEARGMILFGEAKEPGELIVMSVPYLRLTAPDVVMRTAMWEYFLRAGDDVSADSDVEIADLADCYDISYGMIKNACSHAKAAARIRRMEKVGRGMILDSLRELNQVDFSGLATYVRAAYTWDDITITEDQKAVLKVACDRYRLRNRIGQGWGLARKNAYGNGVSLLLYGPPGTGKTMAAQVAANELGIPLYRVDISRIFSKYIGETEKNLSVIFEAAKGANVILFFDEADALFAKRTEIGTSNDKYANSETAHLLQKIEEYDGMSILATNHYTDFDPAFVRRITYSVRLDNPDVEARFLLWTGILPPEAKKEDDIPFRYLAEKFEFSGSNIKSILFSAAYMAGAEGVPVGIRHIVRAMEYEYRKLGRLLDRERFGPYAMYLTNKDKLNAV